MKWLEIHIDTNHAGLDSLVSFLSAQGIDSVVIDDETDFHDFLENNRQYWDYVDEELREKMNGETRVKIYVSDNEIGHKQLQSVRDDLVSFKSLDSEDLFGSLRVEIDTMHEEDWENNWKQYFHPLPIGEKFLVVPSWEKEDGNGRTVIEIDPASSFGTGRHETTALCLEALENLAPENKSVLDMGCGSGILGIGAALLGAKHIDAVDIDMVATRIAEENAEKNNLPDGKMDVVCGNVLADESLWNSFAEKKYDIILANIVADIVILLTQDAPRFMNPDTVYIMSGIIDTREQDVLTALDQCGFTVVERREHGGWLCMVCKK